MTFAKGNRASAQGRLVGDEIRKACVQDDRKKLRAGVAKLMSAFAAGEPWAIEQVLNRMDGKPHQSIDLDAQTNGEISINLTGLSWLTDSIKQRN